MHGCYCSYCHLPLYVFCGEHLVRIRLRWPETRIIVRRDSGFCREDLMGWCEAHDIDYVPGLPTSSRLKAAIATELAGVKAQYKATQQAARAFRDFRYRTRKGWSCERRVFGKAEHPAKGEDPRSVVTSLLADKLDARALHEERYCARGVMQNRIKEQQLALLQACTIDL